MTCPYNFSHPQKMGEFKDTVFPLKLGAHFAGDLEGSPIFLHQLFLMISIFMFVCLLVVF
jgi:hypothetical protein